MTMPTYPDCRFDYLQTAELQSLQLRRLQTAVQSAYDNVALFRKRMDEKGLRPEHIRTLQDVRLLPFTHKSDLRDTYPYGLFARPMKEVVRLHASSGTTGKPIVVGYTRDDMNVWTSVMARTLSMAGVTEHDVVQNCYGYGLFTGGLGAHYGAEAIGATVIPMSGGNTERQIMVMRDFGVTAICSTPSYFLHLIEACEASQFGKNGISLKRGVFGAEPWTNEMRAHIEERAGIKAYDIYGLSEIIGPGVAGECECQNGLHVFEDHFLVETVDPDSGEVLPPGEQGELVITTLSKQAIPMIRYRTHDVTSIIPGPCVCGRTIRKIKKVSHRSDDMMIIRGVNVYPSQIEAAFLKVDRSSPHYQIMLTREGGLDQIEVQVEVTGEMFQDRLSELETLRKRFRTAIEQTTGIRADVRLVEPQTIVRSQGKAGRVIDKRKEEPLR